MFNFKQIPSTLEAILKRRLEAAVEYYILELRRVVAETLHAAQKRAAPRNVPGVTVLGYHAQRDSHGALQPTSITAIMAANGNKDSSGRWEIRLDPMRPMSVANIITRGTGYRLLAWSVDGTNIAASSAIASVEFSDRVFQWFIINSSSPIVLDVGERMTLIVESEDT